MCSFEQYNSQLNKSGEKFKDLLSQNKVIAELESNDTEKVIRNLRDNRVEKVVAFVGSELDHVSSIKMANVGVSLGSGSKVV